MTRAGQAAVAMIDAIVAMRTPYDEQNRPAAAAKARETLEKTEGFQKLAKEDQEKKLAAETKANLLAMWRAVVEKDPAIKELGELQRAAQWRLDCVAAENSMGFHAPQEMARILGESIDMSRQAQFKASEVLHGKVAITTPAASVYRTRFPGQLTALITPPPEAALDAQRPVSGSRDAR
jgi:nitrite reductase (cytochrome c-552)